MAKRSSAWDSILSHFRPLILAQGELTYAYNRLQERFFDVFVLATTLERRQGLSRFALYRYALSLWHVSQNDKQQRHMAMTALASLPTSLEIRGGVDRLDWARKKTDKLSEYRNLIVHTPVNLYPSSETITTTQPLVLIPKIGGTSTKAVNAERLSRIKDTRFWKTLRNDLLSLSDYVDWTTRQIWLREHERKHGHVFGTSHAWPRKPRLRSLRRIAQIERDQTKATPPQSRRARRKPSRRPS